MDLPVPLPPTRIRQGSGPLRFDDDYFVESALESVEVLTTLGLKPGMRLLDFGSGPGRVAIGLIASGWSGSYLGVEVKERHVRWATARVTARFPDFQFVAVDAPNARYNPDGADIRRLPVEDDSIDLICAFSVFSHMLSDDTTVYLNEFRRVLTVGGKAFITAFMADGVPDETENPSWFGQWSGPLHCVLYSTEYLTRLIAEADLTLNEVIVEEGRRQKGLLLSSSGGR